LPVVVFSKFFFHSGEWRQVSQMAFPGAGYTFRCILVRAKETLGYTKNPQGARFCVFPTPPLSFLVMYILSSLQKTA
jgi:hypothetical protein